MSAIVEAYVRECRMRECEPFYGFVKGASEGVISADLDFLPPQTIRLFASALQTSSAGDVPLRAIHLRYGVNKGELHPPVNSHRLLPYPALLARYPSKKGQHGAIVKDPNLCGRLIDGIRVACSRNGESLQSVTLQGLPLNRVHEQALRLMETLKISGIALEALNFSTSHLDDALFIKLFTGTSYKALRDIQFSDCGLTDCSSRCIGALLSQNQQCVHQWTWQTSLRDGKRRSDGLVKARVAALVSKVGGTSMTGAAATTSTATHPAGCCRGAESMDLSCNSLGDATLAHIAAAICTDRSLANLNLSRNMITTRGLNDFLQSGALEESALKVFDVSGNAIVSQNVVLPPSVSELPESSALFLCSSTWEDQLVFTRRVEGSGVPRPVKEGRPAGNQFRGPLPAASVRAQRRKMRQTGEALEITCSAPGGVGEAPLPRGAATAAGEAALVSAAVKALEHIDPRTTPTASGAPPASVSPLPPTLLRDAQLPSAKMSAVGDGGASRNAPGGSAGAAEAQAPEPCADAPAPNVTTIPEAVLPRPFATSWLPASTVGAPTEGGQQVLFVPLCIPVSAAAWPPFAVAASVPNSVGTSQPPCPSAPPPPPPLVGPSTSTGTMSVDAVLHKATSTSSLGKENLEETVLTVEAPEGQLTEATAGPSEEVFPPERFLQSLVTRLESHETMTTESMERHFQNVQREVSQLKVALVDELTDIIGDKLKATDCEREQRLRLELELHQQRLRRLEHPTEAIAEDLLHLIETGVERIQTQLLKSPISSAKGTAPGGAAPSSSAPALGRPAASLQARPATAGASESAGKVEGEQLQEYLNMVGSRLRVMGW